MALECLASHISYWSPSYASVISPNIPSSVSARPLRHYAYHLRSRSRLVVCGQSNTSTLGTGSLSALVNRQADIGEFLHCPCDAVVPLCRRAVGHVQARLLFHSHMTTYCALPTTYATAVSFGDGNYSPSPTDPMMIPGLSPFVFCCFPKFSLLPYLLSSSPYLPRGVLHLRLRTTN